jgi:hypothetical protein
MLHNQMRTGEAISYVASRYNVVDIRVRESPLEDILEKSKNINNKSKRRVSELFKNNLYYCTCQ